MVAAKAFLLMFLLLVSLALIPKETAPARDLLEEKVVSAEMLERGYLQPDLPSPNTVPGKPYRRHCDRSNNCLRVPPGSPHGP